MLLTLRQKGVEKQNWHERPTTGVLFFGLNSRKSGLAFRYVYAVQGWAWHYPEFPCIKSWNSTYIDSAAIYIRLP